MDENKDKLISNIYYSPGGYGSVKNTYNDVVKKDFSITLDYVKDWFKRNILRFSYRLIDTKSRFFAILNKILPNKLNFK